MLQDDKLAGVPVLVFANKQDLDLAMSPDEARTCVIHDPSVTYIYTYVHCIRNLEPYIKYGSFVNLISTQIADRFQLTSITDRRWQIQPCCALRGEGIQVHVCDLASSISCTRPTTNPYTVQCIYVHGYLITCTVSALER